MQGSRKLLVLDLDETLVYASEKRLARPEDFSLGCYCVYLRPHLHTFLAFALRRFDVSVWTSSGETYAAEIVARIFPADALRFVWSSERCTTVRDWETGAYTSVKKLGKLKDKGFDLNSVIAIDDTPAKYANSFGNLVAVQEFVGSETDDELFWLSSYLDWLADVPNVRKVEKRGWRKHMENNAMMSQEN